MRQFEAIFARASAIDLPGVTVFAIQVAHLGIRLAPMILVLLAVDWSVLRALYRRGEAGKYHAWAVAMLVAPLLLLAATAAALALPLIKITNLSG